jgi:8-oxo-dGTP pyrophosphatase MutT (NUDIX family)
MIKIYFKDRYISLTEHKLEIDSPKFQSISMHKVGDIKIQINRFTTNNKLQHLNIFGTDEKRGLKFVEKTLTPIIAGGGLVRNDQGLYLFIFRNGKWDLPKGKSEENETPEICALREVSEECNMNLKLLEIEKPIGSTFHIYKQNRSTFLKQTHWYQMSYGGNPELIKPQTEENIERCIWVDEETIPKLMKNTYASIRNFIQHQGFNICE